MAAGPLLVAQFILPAVLAIIAVTVLVAAPREPRNRFFAAFLLLVAGNYWFGSMDWYSVQASGGFRTTITWLRGAYVLLALDPFFLLYFASVYPERSRLNAWRFIAPVGLVSAVLAFAAAGATVGSASVYSPGIAVRGFFVPVRWPLLAFMYACYLTAFLGMYRVATRAPDARVRAQARLLIYALAAVIVPRVGLLAHDLALPFPFVGAGSWWSIPTTLLLGCAGFAGVYGLTRVPWRGGPAPHAERHIWPGAAVAAGSVLAVILAIDAVDVLTRPGTGGAFGAAFRAAVGDAAPLHDVIAFTRYAIRWIAFSVLVGYALLRDQVFDLDLRVKQAFVAAQLLLAAVTVTALVIVALPRWTEIDEVQVPLPLLLAGGLLAVGARPATRAAQRLAECALPWLGADAASLRARRLEVYRARVDRLAPSGTRDHPRLARLRARLGITDVEHARILAQRGTRPVVPGRSLLAGRYRVTEILGEGGEAFVALAVDEQTGMLVAVKRVRGDAVDARTRGHLLREATIMRDVSHPCVLRVLDVTLDAGHVLVVMEYAPGGSLRDAVRARGALDPGDAARLMLRVLDALAAAHARGVVHRDVKPSNVLLAADGTPRLADFGIAHVRDADVTWGGTGSHGAGAPGTRAYMAPEHAAGAAVDARADVYAAALVLLDLVTGTLATDLADPPARVTDPRVPPAWRPVLARALAQSPRTRFPDAAAFRDALAASSRPEGRVLTPGG